MGHRSEHAVEHDRHVARQQIHGRRCAALVGDADHFYVVHLVKQLAREMRQTAETRRTVVQLARPRPRECCQFAHVFHRQRWMHDENKRRLGNQRQVSEITQRIEGHFCLNRRRDRVRRRHGQQGVTIGWRFDHHLSTDVARSAGPIVDDELLAGILGELLRHQAAQNIRRPARRIGHDDTAGLDRIARFLCGLPMRRRSRHQ